MRTSQPRLQIQPSHIKGFGFAILSAIFFSLNVPVSKWLLDEVSPYWLASLLYFGAGVGTYLFQSIRRKQNVTPKRLKNSLVWFALMIFLDILAPIFFLLGALQTDGNLIGLLSNAELIFTLVFAIILFKEALNGWSWVSLLFIFTGIVLANLNMNFNSFQINQLWILLATFLWGFENNISRKLSFGNPLHVVIIKGIGTGIGTLIIAIVLNEPLPAIPWIFLGLIFGFFIYGVSLIFYVMSQRQLGAAKVQMIQSFAPIFGGIIAWMVFQETLIITTQIGYGCVMVALMVMGYDALGKKPS
jgi:drug/metabolite transporter (DMT)-like permease